jgi:hypothetical protein
MGYFQQMLRGIHVISITCRSFITLSSSYISFLVSVTGRGIIMGLMNCTTIKIGHGYSPLFFCGCLVSFRRGTFFTPMFELAVVFSSSQVTFFFFLGVVLLGVATKLSSTCVYSLSSSSYVISSILVKIKAWLIETI